MTKQVTLEEAQSQLPALLKGMGAGDDVIIESQGKPVARLTAISHSQGKRKPGGAEHLFEVVGDFNEPLPPDVENAFYR